jgi:hypothetical protein
MVLPFYTSLSSVLYNLIQAWPFPSDEWIAEWHKPTTFLVYIVPIGANKDLYSKKAFLLPYLNPWCKGKNLD